MSFRQCAIEVLEKSRNPLSINEITKRALEMGLRTKGKTPEATMRGTINKSIDRERDQSPFKKIDSSNYTLRRK